MERFHRVFFKFWTVMFAPGMPREMSRSALKMLLYHLRASRAVCFEAWGRFRASSGPWRLSIGLRALRESR